MNNTFKTSLVAVAASFAIIGSASAALIFSNGYGSAAYYTNPDPAFIFSYDWGPNGSLYYGTADSSSYQSAGVYQTDGISPRLVLASASSDYAGASVVAIGSSIYYNDSNYPDSGIYRHDVGVPGSTKSLATNWGLFTNGTSLFVTGAAAFGDPTGIVAFPNGDLSGPTVDLGGIAGASGPLAFDAAGNLFYAPGYGDLSIYRWSASQVADAVNGTVPLTASANLWFNYGNVAAYQGVAGGTSLAVDSNGNVLIALTNFSDLSYVVKFNADNSGAYGNSYTQLLENNAGRLGEIRIHEGELFAATGNQIIRIIPEPASVLLSVLGVAGFFLRRRRA